MDDLHILKLVQAYKNEGQHEIADELLAVLIKQQSLFENLRDKIDENLLLIEDSRDALKRMHDRLDVEIDKLLDAFPEKDLHGHKKAHHIFIDRAIKHSKRKEAVLQNLTTAAIWAFIIFVARLVWDYIRAEL